MEAIEWVLKTGGKDKLDKYRYKITGSGDDFKKVANIRDDYTVQNVLRDYAQSQRPKKKIGANEKLTTTSSLAEGIASDYVHARDPLGEFEAPTSTLSDGELGLAICQRSDNGAFKIHEVLATPDDMVVKALRHSTELPTSGIDAKVNFVCELLHVASKVCPDLQSTIPMKKVSVTSTANKENNRQFLFLPEQDEIIVGYPRASGLPSMRISGLDCWPYKPTLPGLLRTQQRKKIDFIANRVDRRTYTVTDAVRESGQKWVSKILLTPQGGALGLPVQIDPILDHNLDVYVPDLRGAQWEASVTFDRTQLLEFYRRHLSPYSKSKKSEDKARIVAFSFGPEGCLFDYDGIDVIPVNCVATKSPQKTVRVQAVGKDWVQAFAGLIALETTEPISLKVDSTGCFELSTRSRHARYAIYIAAVMEGEKERSSRYFISARRLLETSNSENDEAADAA